MTNNSKVFKLDSSVPNVDSFQTTSSHGSTRAGVQLSSGRNPKRSYPYPAWRNNSAGGDQSPALSQIPIPTWSTNACRPWTRSSDVGGPFVFGNSADNLQNPALSSSAEGVLSWARSRNPGGFQNPSIDSFRNPALGGSAEGVLNWTRSNNPAGFQNPSSNSGSFLNPSNNSSGFGFCRPSWPRPEWNAFLARFWNFFFDVLLPLFGSLIGFGFGVLFHEVLETVVCVAVCLCFVFHCLEHFGCLAVPWDRILTNLNEATRLLQLDENFFFRLEAVVSPFNYVVSGFIGGFAVGFIVA